MRAVMFGDKATLHSSIRTSCCLKQGGANVLVWARCAAFGTGRLAIIDEPMNSELLQQILKENVRISVCEKLGHAARQ